MWYFLHLISSISFLLTLSFLPFQSFSFSASLCWNLHRHREKRQTWESQCPIWTGFSNKTLSLRITLGPCPSMTSADSCAAVATSNLRLRKKGRWEGGEEIGREIKSSVEASEMRGLYNSSQALYLWAPPFSSSITFSLPFYLSFFFFFSH